MLKQFESSKTPARKPLQPLAAEGLVEVLPKKGYLVCPMTSQDLGEVLTMRMLLEPCAAAQAARFATPEDVAELPARLERQVAAELAAEITTTTHARSFHEFIAEHAANSRVTDALTHCFSEMVRAHHVIPEMRAHLATIHRTSIAAHTPGVWH